MPVLLRSQCAEFCGQSGHGWNCDITVLQAELCLECNGVQDQNCRFGKTGQPLERLRKIGVLN